MSSNIRIQESTTYKLPDNKPIYLSSKQIQELDEIFFRWVEKIKVLVSNSPNEDVKKMYTTYGYRVTAEVLLELDNEKKLKGVDATSLFKIQDAHDHLMKKLEYNISFRSKVLTLTCERGKYSNRLELYCHDDSVELNFSAYELFCDFRDWIRKIERSELENFLIRFASLYRSLWWLLAFLGLWIPLAISESNNSLKEDAQKLLANGLSQDEVLLSQEIILKKVIGFTDNSALPSWSGQYYIGLVVVILALLIYSNIVNGFGIESGKGRKNYVLQQNVLKFFPGLITSSVIISLAKKLYYFLREI